MAKASPCMQTLRLRGPGLHVLGATVGEGGWQLRAEACLANRLGPLQEAPGRLRTLTLDGRAVDAGYTHRPWRTCVPRRPRFNRAVGIPFSGGPPSLSHGDGAPVGWKRVFQLHGHESFLPRGDDGILSPCGGSLLSS